MDAAGAHQSGPTGLARHDLVHDLLRRSALFVTGKGGVGKSTVATALARLAVRQGKRVLLVELESVSRAGPLFQRTLGPQPVQVDTNLSACCLQTMDSLRFFALQQLKVPALVNLALRNRAVERFFQAVPAIKPILFLYQLWRMESDHGPGGDRRYDLIICDLPTTGFALGMYAIPRTLAQVFRLGPIAHYAEGMRQFLTDPARSGVVLVALPEEMPVQETVELGAALRQRHGVDPAAIVLNGVCPEIVTRDEIEGLVRACAGGLATSGAADAEPLAAWLWAARVVADRHSRARNLLPRLKESASGRVVTLPFQFRRDLPLPIIDELADCIAGTARSPA